MRRLIRLATLLPLAIAGCQKAEIPDPEANGIVVRLESNTVSSDFGIVTAEVQVLEDGVALLEHPVTVRVNLVGAGPVADIPEQVVTTDEMTGVATVTFSDAEVVGSYEVEAQVGGGEGALTGSAPFQVIPGIPDSMTLTVAQSTVAATSGSLTITSIVVLDGMFNEIPDAPIFLTTDAPGALVSGTSLEGLHVAGAWTLHAEVSGLPLVADTEGFTVTPGETSEVRTELGQSSVTHQQTLDVRCLALDDYGNDTGFDFTAATSEVQVSVPGTVTEDGADQEPGDLFHVNAFSTSGIANVTCSDGSLSGVESFSVIDSTAPTTVQFSVISGNPDNTSPYDAGTTLTIGFRSTDTVGVASQSIAVDPSSTSAATITSASEIQELAGETDSGIDVFTVRVLGSTAAPSTVVLRGQARDTTGNVRQSTLSVSVSQAATAVVTTLTSTTVEASATLDFNCKQINAATGEAISATFTTSDVSTTAPGAVVSPLGSNNFRLSGFTAKGNYTATCTLSAQSDAETFSVFDVTAPTVSQHEITTASGPNGVTTDNKYADGTNFTLTVDATDTIGVARVDVTLIGTGGAYGDVASADSIFFPAGTTSVVDAEFDINLGVFSPTFSTLTIRTQVTDTTGNVRQPADIVLTVDPAVGIAVAPGVTLRTFYEHAVLDFSPIALAINGTGGSLHVERSTPVTTNVDDIIRITGSTTFVTVASDFVGGGFADDASGGMVFVPAGYGSPTPRNLFHTLYGNSGHIGTLNGATPLTFNTTATEPNDVSYGTIGADTQLWCVDVDGLNPTKILKIAPDGTSTDFFVDTLGADVIPNAPSLVASGGFLFVAETNGNVVRFDSTAASTVPLDFADNDALDIVVAGPSNKILVAGGTTSTVYRGTVAGGAETEISSDLDTPVGLAVGPSGLVYVLDVGISSGHPWRIYSVTGY